MLKVIYLENSVWEFDFITKDLLQNIETEVIFYNNDNIYKLLQIPDIIENNVLITKNGHKDLMKNIPITAEEIESLMKK